MDEKYNFDFKNLSELSLNDIPDEAGIYAFRLIDDNSFITNLFPQRKINFFI